MKTSLWKKVKLVLASVLMLVACSGVAACDLGLNDAFNLGIMPGQEEGQDLFGYLGETLLNEYKDDIVQMFQDNFMDEIRDALAEEFENILDEGLTNDEILEEVRTKLLNDDTLRKEIQDSILDDGELRNEIQQTLMDDPAFQNDLIDGIIDNDAFMEKLIATEEFQSYIDQVVAAAVADAMADYTSGGGGFFP